jgi:hypothetical protein
LNAFPSLSLVSNGPELLSNDFVMKILAKFLSFSSLKPFPYLNEHHSRKSTRVEKKNKNTVFCYKKKTETLRGDLNLNFIVYVSLTC